MKNLKLKTRFWSALTLAVLAAAALTACSVKSSSFSIVSDLNNTTTINSENSGTDTDGSGSIVVGDSEMIVVDASITSGALNLQFVESGSGQKALEQDFSASGRTEFPEIGPGEYEINAKVSQADFSGKISIYTEASTADSAAPAAVADTKENETKEAETDAADVQTAEEAEDDSSLELKDSSGATEFNDGDGDDSSDLLIQAAETIYDSLDESWGEDKKVSYNVDEDTIYVLAWEKDINTADILVSSTWEEMKQWHIDTYNAFWDYMEEAGIPDAHLDYRYAADHDDVSFLTLLDGEIVYDIHEDGLPGFVYTGEDPYLNTIWEYLRDTESMNYDPGDVMIPAFVILEEDEEDPQDIKVWGSYWLINYDLDGTKLITKNGGCYPACIHLAETEDGYKVTDAEFVEDGSNYDPTARAIFGAKEGLLEAFEQADDRLEECRTEYINMYAEKTGIDIQSYED